MIRRSGALVALLAVLAGCSVALPSSGASTAPETSAPTAAAASGGETSVAPTDPPPDGSGPRVALPTDVPPTDVPPTDSPATDPAPRAGSADPCTGNDQNREFYEQAAAAVDWPVFCAVLPRGWFVHTGSYRLAGGGRLVIAYNGRDGARLELSEGAFCSSDDGCVPPGTDAGGASFGRLPGTLVALDGGAWAVVAARGQKRSWLLIARGLDQATATEYAAALHEVGG